MASLQPTARELLLVAPSALGQETSQSSAHCLTSQKCACRRITVERSMPRGFCPPKHPCFFQTCRSIPAILVTRLQLGPWPVSQVDLCFAISEAISWLTMIPTVVPTQNPNTPRYQPGASKLHGCRCPGERFQVTNLVAPWKLPPEHAAMPSLSGKHLSACGEGCAVAKAINTTWQWKPNQLGLSVVCR